MDVAIRPLEIAEIDQVREIEREAFSTTWPQASFRRDLDNNQVTYLIAWEPRTPEDKLSEETPGSSAATAAPTPTRLVNGLRQIISRNKRPSPDSVVGYVGMWFMGTEAHITAIAVRQAIQGQGVGELLLMGSIEVAMKRGSAVVSLEVRVSNRVAQSLYNKYGFANVGLRKGYYTDNREDAVIMTTEPINTPEYHAKLDHLQEAYRQRRGKIEITLA